MRKLLGEAGSDRSLRRKLSQVPSDPPAGTAPDVNDTPTIPRKLRTGELGIPHMTAASSHRPEKQI